MTTRADHPAVRVRRIALARLARQFPARCESDREDAVHEALCAALRLGRADNARAVSGWAARILTGMTREHGRLRSARSAATSIAGHALPDVEGEPQAPADWIDSSARTACGEDMAATLDLAAWETLGAVDVARETLGALRDEGLSWADVARLVSRCGRKVSADRAQRWSEGQQVPPDPEAVAEAALEAMRALDLPAPRGARAWPAPAWLAPRPKPAPPPPPPPTEAQILVGLARRAAGSGARLARRLGVHHVTVYRWSSGMLTPGAEHLAALRRLTASHAHHEAP